jgi:uncharacterized protein DUF5681
MTKRKGPTATRGDRRGYEVGYGKPPKHSQFRPGESGNSAGRRKGLRNLKIDVKRTLAMPVKVKGAGRTRTRSTQEGALLSLREKALRGNERALNRLLELAERHNNDATEIGPTQALPSDDQAILDAYAAEVRATETAPVTTPSSNDTASPPAAGGNKKARK